MNKHFKHTHNHTSKHTLRRKHKKDINQQTQIKHNNKTLTQNREQLQNNKT